MARTSSKSTQDIIAELDSKIKYHQKSNYLLNQKILKLKEKIDWHEAKITKLEHKKKNTLNPPISLRTIMEKARKMGMSPSQVADILGIHAEDDYPKQGADDEIARDHK